MTYFIWTHSASKIIQKLNENQLNVNQIQSALLNNFKYNINFQFAKPENHETNQNNMYFTILPRESFNKYLFLAKFAIV
jgi:hypothetical protein